MLEMLSLVACGWLLMFNEPANDLKLPITEWGQVAAYDSAAECQTALYRITSAAEKIGPFKLDLSRWRCIPADVIYPPKT